ncbi:Non-specific phospholipase C4 [Linum perenne]
MVTESTTPESSSSPSQSPIKTVVVLVQENRSFDHMLGWLKTINPEINGVTGSESNPISTSDSNSNLVYFKDQAAYVDPDPGHSIQAIYEQVFGVTWSAESAASNPTPKMNGFAQNAERTQKGMAETVMNGFKPDAVPVYKELAENFAVCDQWFASVPASTQPNRLYVHSATSHGATSNDTKQLAEGFPQKTIFESMEESGFSFGIYYQYPPATLFYRNLRKLKYVDNFHQFDLSFKKHCEEGKLPNYVVVEQRYFDVLSIPGNDDHPSHDISQGQKFVKQVYESLRFEHSSIPATVKKIFNLNDFLTKRDAWAGTFDSILTLTTPRTDCPRQYKAKGEAKLNEFQEVMVQMTAALLGEHKKKNSNYPDKLVQGMTVADALKFSDDGYKKFIDECGKARANGADDNDIIVCFAEEAAANSKSAFHKFFSCLVCNHS